MGDTSMNSSVSVAKIAELLDLKNFTDEIDLKKRKITTTDINRPALQLTGYFEHFEESRVEIIGNVEYAYIQQMSDEEKRIRYDAFLKFDIPCVIFSRNLTPDPIFLKEALANQVPVLGTGRSTSEFTAELMGIDTHVITAISWALACALGVLAAVMYAGGGAMISASFMAIIQVNAFLACILGGFSTFYGSVVGAILIPVITNCVGFLANFPAFHNISRWQLVIVYLLLMIVILIKPQGLFGKKVVKKV